MTTRLVRQRCDAVLALAGTFYRHGFEGAGLSTILTETGLGRGSLHHFFPGGKHDMATAVLDEVQAWFDREIYTPLRGEGDPETLIGDMLEATVAYFASREFVCLFAAIPLGQKRDTFGAATRGYFADWLDALAATLRSAGMTPEVATEAAVDVVSGIQGALILARALHDDTLVRSTLARIQVRAHDAISRCRLHPSAADRTPATERRNGPRGFGQVLSTSRPTRSITPPCCSSFPGISEWSRRARRRRSRRRHRAVPSCSRLGAEPTTRRGLRCRSSSRPCSVLSLPRLAQLVTGDHRQDR